VQFGGSVTSLTMPRLVLAVPSQPHAVQFGGSVTSLTMPRPVLAVPSQPHAVQFGGSVTSLTMPRPVLAVPSQRLALASRIEPSNSLPNWQQCRKHGPPTVAYGRECDAPCAPLDCKLQRWQGVQAV
jgi:hypothetical protein